MADAKKAVELGVDGIIISNHAGRQVDGAIASLDALEKIVDGEFCLMPFLETILTECSCWRQDLDYVRFWSSWSIRRLQGIGLGAKFVFVGRLWVWGLSIKGELSVRHVMKSLLTDFDILMNVSGFQSVDQITRDSIESLSNSAAMIAENSRL